MATTYEPLATTTLSTDTASVTFSSISGNYTDLVLIITGKNPAAANEIYGQFNSDTGSNYSYTQLSGSGAAPTSARVSNSNTMRFGFSNNDNSSSSIIHIMNYSNTTTYKTALSKIKNIPYSQLLLCANLWRSTAAITSIKLTMESAVDFNAGSTFTLYGIKAA